MEILDTYKELIETNSNDISICWKISQIFFYLLSATSGYASAILFYILWNDIFADHCPLWAHIVSPIFPRIMSEDIPAQEPLEVAPDWREKIIVTSQHSSRCNVYHFVSLCSCVFGVIWMIIFAMCGKGGYDIRIFIAPWRVVPLALIFQFIFSIVTMFVVYDMDCGYSKFAKSLHEYGLNMNDTQLPEHKKQCDIVQYYLEIYGSNRHNVCQVYPALRVLSWIMAWSWVLGLLVLLLRIIMINDFRLLRVTIRKIPKDEVKKYSDKRGVIESDDSA